MRTKDLDPVEKLLVVVATGMILVAIAQFVFKSESPAEQTISGECVDCRH